MQYNASEGMIKYIGELFLGKKGARTGVLLQLFLTHGITSAIALALVFGLTHLGISLLMSILGAIVASGGFGLLLTVNIQYTVHLVERTVIAISQGQPAASIPTFSWPLTQLFASLGTLDQRMQIYTRGEQAAVKIRQHYLQQASEIATRTERQRIARDLHDSIKQQLFGISVSAAAVNAYLSKDISKAQAAIADIQRVAKESQVEMQALLQQLGATPLENTKLSDALHTQAEALKYRSGLEMKLTIGDLPADELLPEGTQETIFRLVQEALANIARHARAKAVTITLQQTERALHLIISDNGKGFDVNVARAGMGLTNMRERVAALNGTIDVQSALEQGTTVHIAIPLIQLQLSVEVEEKTWSEQELSQGKERAISGFQVGYTALNIAWFFLISNTSTIFIPIPNVAIAICMLISGYGFWRGHSWKMRLISYLGKENMDVLRLQQREEKILWLLLYALSYAGSYFLRLQKGWGDRDLIMFSIVLVVLFIVWMFFLYRRGYATRGRIYRAMAPDEVKMEITYQRRKVIYRIRLVGILMFVGLVVGGEFVLSHPLTGVVQGSIIVCTPLFLILCGTALFEFIVLWQQRQAVEGEQKKVSLGSVLRGK